MRLTKPLNDITGNSVRVEILRTFIMRSGEYTGHHIARLTGIPQPTVLRHLDVLEHYALLQSRWVGRGKVFTINDKYALYDELVALFKKESTILNTIIRILRASIKKSDQVNDVLLHVSLFGSVVTGYEQRESDLDLLCVIKNRAKTSPAYEWVDQVSIDLENKTGGSLHPLILKKSELNDMKKSLRSNLTANSQLVYGTPFLELIQNG